jgi:hypoxanthine phosphoribosyltransferase
MMKPVATEEEIAARIAELGAQLRKDAGDAEIVFLCVLKGACVFLSDLLRRTPGKVRYEFIDKVQDFADNTIADAMEIDFFGHADIRGKNVYLLKDVVTSGVIDSYLLTQLRSREPASLCLVALLDRPEARTVELDCMYAAFTVSDGTFVGYGLDQQGEHSNLPYIARLA